MQRPSSFRPAFNIEAIKFALLALGLLALLAGVAMLLVYQDLTVPVRVLLAVGIILIGAYVAIDPEDVWGRLTGRGALYGGNTLITAVAGLGILALVNVLAGQPPVHQRWDLTASGEFTLSEQSKAIVSQLPQPVHATGYFVGQDRDQQDNADSLLKQYQAASNGKLTYEFVDPEQQPSKAIQAGVRTSGTVVFQMGDQKQNATSVSEQDFTAALLKVVNPTPRKVYFTTGHGERDTNNVREEGFSTLLQLIKQENIQADNVNLLTAGKVPDDTSVLIVAAPTKQFQDPELKAIQAYLDRGGSLMLLADRATTPQVADLVKQWNVQIKFDPVLDPAQSYPQDPLTPIVTKYIFHAITKSMDGILTVWPEPIGLIFPKDQAPGVFTAPLAETSDRSWMETNFDQEVKAQKVQFDDKDVRGPISLAGVIEADAKQQPPADPNNPSQQPKKTRVVLFGDADFVSNQVLQRLQTGNQDFFLNSVNWLTESEQLISIRPKEQDTRQLVLTNTQSNLVWFSSVLFIPLLVLGAGAFVWWTRR